MLVLGCISVVDAQTTYTALSTGNWTNPDIWDVYPGTTINAGDEVVIGGNYEVTIDVTITNYGTLLNNNGTGKIINNGTILNYNELTINGFISNRITGIIDNHSNFTINYRVDSYGEIINRATIDANNVFTNFGTVTNNTGGVIENEGLLKNNPNAIFVNNSNINNHGAINNYGTFTNNNRINSWVSTQIINYNGEFLNNGTMDGDGTVRNVSILINEGAIYTVNFNNSGFFTNNGSFYLTGGTFINTGTILGRNSNHSGYFENAGTLSPGNSPGIYRINSNYNHTSTAILEIEISNQGVAGVAYDQVIVNATATLDGTLNVSLLNNYNPTLGATFTILTANSITGAFATLNLPTLTDKEWEVTYNAGTVILTVVSTLTIEDMRDKANLLLYPNPMQDSVNINSPNQPIKSIQITDLNGRAILTIDGNNSYQTLIDISTLTNGLYFVTVETSSSIQTIKVVKK